MATKTTPGQSLRHSYCRALLFLPLVLCSAMLSPRPACGQEPPPMDVARLEYRIKAAYLYNFVHFVKWQEDALAPDEPVSVCVLGDNPFNGGLEPITERTAYNHSFRLQYLKNLEEQKGCHVLFISSSEKKNLGSILEEVRGESILTVGELPDFALQGGIIGFVTRNGKIRLEINTRAARWSKLKISAKLLELSTIVE